MGKLGIPPEEIPENAGSNPAFGNGTRALVPIFLVHMGYLPYGLSSIEAGKRM